MIQVELGDGIMMDKKKIILIALIIIILVLCTILITSQNNTKDSDNFNLSTNNTTKNNISNKTLENNSKNNQATELDENNIFSSSSINAKNHLSNAENKNKLVEVTADDIKKLVEENVYWSIGLESTKDVRIGEPNKLKSGSWLVPGFNKDTGKFLGAVLVSADTYKGADGKFGVLYSHGTSSYSVYNDLISGKKVKYSDWLLGEAESNLNEVSPDDSVLRSAASEPSNDDSNQVLDEIEETSDLNNTTV